MTFTSLDQYRGVLNGDHTDPNDPSSPLVTPAQFTINRGNPFVRYNPYEASWFVQDDWRVRPNFTLSLGVRHEFQSHLDDKLNFAPRLGIAWSPLRDRKMTVRAGGGIFFSRLTGGLFENTLRFDGVNEQSIIIRNPLFPDPFAGTPVIDPGKTITDTLAPDLKAPYVVNFTTSVERQLPQGLLTSITYIYARGVHQFRTRNINASLPGTFVPGIADSGIHPFGDVGNIYELESSANSIFHGVMFRLDRRFGRSFTFFSSYTLSWTRNDADGPGALPADNYNLGPEWEPALTDRRNHLFIGGNVNLPHGFRLTPFIIAASGGPFDITTGSDDNGDDVINDRPPGVNRNSDLPASLYPLIPDRCIANCLLGETPVILREYLMTNFPNGIHAVGPGLFNVNLGISKIFGFGHRASQAAQQGGQDRPRAGGGGRRGGGGGAFGGFGGEAGQGRGGLGGGAVAESSRFNIQLSAQITNIFNRVNLGQFSGVLSSPFFDRANGAGPARQYELNLRFSF